MLVLSRKVGERICIGNGIVITLVATSGDRARIGIDAPVEIAVDREEIRRRKNSEATPLPLPAPLPPLVPCHD